jgi:bifunctional UDP-N-acetylglucosamine pyrophosphorylase/glucosamine-1-phosphate N-acetyltransferase
LVAPVKVGDGAIVAAGSVIAKDVAADALAITRAPQEQRPGWAVKYRTRKKAEKEAAPSCRKGGRAKKAG